MEIFYCEKIGGQLMNQEMVIKKVKISDIKPAAYNPRKDLKPGDPAFEKIETLHDRIWIC